MQQGEEILQQGQLLSQVLTPDVGAAQGQHHGQQLKAVGVRGGVLIAGLGVGVLLARNGVLPFFSDPGGFHADGLHDMSADLITERGVGGN